MRISCSVAAIAALAFVVTAVQARAGDEVLLRKPLEFAQCPATVASMLAALKADPDRVNTEVHTGAIYRVRVVASTGSLVFLCGKSSGTIEVVRSDVPDQIAGSD